MKIVNCIELRNGAVFKKEQGLIVVNNDDSRLYYEHNGKTSFISDSNGNYLTSRYLIPIPRFKGLNRDLMEVVSNDTILVFVFDGLLFLITDEVKT